MIRCFLRLQPISQLDSALPVIFGFFCFALRNWLVLLARLCEAAPTAINRRTIFLGAIDGASRFFGRLFACGADYLHDVPFINGKPISKLTGLSSQKETPPLSGASIGGRFPPPDEREFKRQAAVRPSIYIAFQRRSVKQIVLPIPPKPWPSPWPQLHRDSRP
jgi:hypothetical protein